MAFNRKTRRKVQKKMFRGSVKSIDEKAMDDAFNTAFDRAREQAREEASSAVTNIILMAASVVVYCDYNKIRNKDERLVNFAKLVKQRVEELSLPPEEQPQEIAEVSVLLEKGGILKAKNSG